jgi:hypothetical protein
MCRWVVWCGQRSLPTPDHPIHFLQHLFALGSPLLMGSLRKTNMKNLSNYLTLLWDVL